MVLFSVARSLQSLAELEKRIQEQSDARQELLERIKIMESKMQHLSKMMEHAHTVTQYRSIYQYHKENPKDKKFDEEYMREIMVYKVAATEILKHYKKLPNTKELLKKLNTLDQKKSKLLSDYSNSKSALDKLFAIRRNFKTFHEITLDR